MVMHFAPMIPRINAGGVFIRNLGPTAGHAIPLKLRQKMQKACVAIAFHATTTLSDNGCEWAVTAVRSHKQVSSTVIRTYPMIMKTLSIGRMAR